MTIVSSNSPVTLIGGGEATIEEVRTALSLAPLCVAVDGGLSLALAAKADPVAVIGDMDSVSSEALALMPPDKRYEISEQDSTDFDKALRNVSAPVCIAVGFAGGRIDHQLAVFHRLVARPDRPCVVISGEQIVLLAPPSVRVPTQAGDVVSLFPMDRVTGRSTGLEWPIEGLVFHPTSQSGTSNRATGEMSLEVDDPAMLLILPIALIQPVVAQLVHPDAARWPAREE